MTVPCFEQEIELNPRSNVSQEGNLRQVTQRDVMSHPGLLGQGDAFERVAKRDSEREVCQIRLGQQVVADRKHEPHCGKGHTRWQAVQGLICSLAGSRSGTTCCSLTQVPVHRSRPAAALQKCHAASNGRNVAYKTSDC
jgi:hypothetical protein